METSSSLTAAPRRTAADHAHIQGWGADLDRKQRPAVPMERTPPRLPGANLGPPEQQRQTMEVFVSPVPNTGVIAGRSGETNTSIVCRCCSAPVRHRRA
jgi:hypothetical protein